MSTKKLLLLLLFFSVVIANSASAWQFVRIDWNATFDTGNPESMQGVAIDTQDNVIVTGIVNQDFVTVKYNSAGIQQWNDTYNLGGVDLARGVAADSADNIYVTGSGGAVNSIQTAKYNSSGSRIGGNWPATYVAGGNNAGYSVAIDSSDNVIIAGAGGTPFDFITIKYNSSGSQQWIDILDVGSVDVARGVAIDSQDNIIVSGYSNVSGVNDFFVVKYDSSGNQIWNTSYDSGFSDAARRVAVDSNDNIYVSGYRTTSPQREDYVTVKFNSSGSYVWNITINKSNRDVENSVAVDNNDNIVVTGQSGAAAGAYDYFTMFFYPNSTQQFNLTFDAGDDLAVDVATDSDNSIIVAGFSDSVSASGNDDYFVLKYLINPSCGQVLTGDTVLNQDLNCSGTALIINSSNVTLDCQGHTITGDTTGDGISIDSQSSITIQNCRIHNFTRGIYAKTSDHLEFYNDSVGYSTRGYYMDSINNSLFMNNSAYFNGFDGFYLMAFSGGCYNNRLINNTAWNMSTAFSGIGFHLEGFPGLGTFNKNNTFVDNFAYNNNAYGFDIDNNNENNNLTRNRATNNRFSGIQVYYSDHNNLTNNTLYNNSGSGIILHHADDCFLTRNNAYDNLVGINLFVSLRNSLVTNWAFNNSGEGFYLDRSDFTNMTNNTAYGNNLSGVYLDDSDNCTARNGRSYSNGRDGIQVFDSNSADIYNNYLYGNNHSGVLVYKPGGGGPGSNVRVFDNTIYNNSRDGAYIYNTANEFIIGNNITLNSRYGIHIENSNSIDVVNNTVLNHTYSINLTNASSNTIYNNYFQDMPYADAASTGNSWNITKTLGTNIIGGPYLGGNFWNNYTGSDTDGDGLGDTNLPWKGITNGIVNGGDFHPLVFPFVKDIQCEFNNSGTFLNCNNATFFANITRVRVNCTSSNGVVSNATFSLTNIFDSHTFFTNTTSILIGGYYVLDNPNVQILDSGYWTLNATCTNTSGAKRNGSAPFFIPFGNISGSVIVPPGNTNVQNGSTFNVTCRMQCSGGECVHVNVTLDPINPNTNLTQPTQPVHAVFADSDFIYGAAENQGLYVWNKTGLGLFAVINASMPWRTVFADSDYIYAGGVGGINGNLTLWNRTDLAAPFSGVVNISFPGGVYSIKSDNKYIYAAGGNAFGGTGRLGVYNKSTFASVVNITFADVVRGMDIDNTSIYTVSHACEINVTNMTGFVSITSLAVPAACSQIKAISVDDGYILVTGFNVGGGFPPPYNAWTRVYNKTSYALLYEVNDSVPSQGLAAEIGGPDFAYFGGMVGSFIRNGTIFQLNKSSFVINDSINVTNWTIKGLYCDDDYLYAAAGEWNIWDGMVMLFNNSCGGPAPPIGISVNSLVVRPAALPVPGTAHCSANVTTAGIIANVTFNITFPGGGSVLLPGTNVGGDIFNSSNFTVSSTGLHVCTVFANNTNGSSATRSRNFYGGNKGIVPMNSGSPFYTINQNPRYPANQSCLNSTIPGNDCDSSWNVSVNGTNGTTWQFFCIYESAQSGDVNTSRIDITIGQPAPPPPPPTPSGGGGGGATRQYPQECVEAWSCGNWGACISGVKRRICTDANNCGTSKSRPAESMACIVPFAEKLEQELAAKEEPAMPSFEEINEKEHIVEGSAVVVEEPSANPWKNWLSGRSFVRAALLVLVVSILTYLFFLSRHLKKSATVQKKDRLTDESFAAAAAAKSAAKPGPVAKSKLAPKPISKETTEELLKELNKL